MSYHGIPIRLVPDNPETHEPESTYETVVFATLRRCPKLTKLLKTYNTKDVADDAARMKAILAKRAILQAETPEAVDAAAKVAEAASAAAEQATADLANVVHEFLLAGFVGAGYTDDQAERYASMVPPQRLAEIKAAALVGSGRLDFTKALPGA